jgi:hypothetical protein
LVANPNSIDCVHFLVLCRQEILIIITFTGTHHGQMINIVSYYEQSTIAMNVVLIFLTFKVWVSASFMEIYVFIERLEKISWFCGEFKSNGINVEFYNSWVFNL